MVVSFRDLFLSKDKKQVESEARNIGLAHTIRDLITGSNHETHVDTYQKKKVVKALQKADLDQVNDLISILKAMPDPTVVEFKTVHSRDPSKQHGSTSPPPAKGGNNGENGTDIGKDPEEGEPLEGPVKAPSSWWAVSFGSLLSSLSSSNAPSPSAATTTTTTVTSIVIETEEVIIDDDVSESKAENPASTPPAPTDSDKEKGKGGKGDKGGTVTKSVKTTTITNGPDKATLTSTITSIKKQIAALHQPPPTHIISAYTFWWGYEIYVPHKCMAKLQRVTNTSQIFFGFLSGAVVGIPGLAALVPLSRIISAWVGFQWSVIKAQDLGKGVVLSATWVLPVALAPRPWDHPGTEEDPPAASPQSKMNRIKAE